MSCPPRFKIQDKGSFISRQTPPNVNITRVISLTYLSNTSKHRTIHWFNSCFTHVATTLASSSTHTRLTGSNTPVHYADFCVLHRLRVESCPVEGPKRSTSQLFFSPRIRFERKPENGRTQRAQPDTARTPPSVLHDADVLQTAVPSSNLQLHVWKELHIYWPHVFSYGTGWFAHPNAA